MAEVGIEFRPGDTNSNEVDKQADENNPNDLSTSPSRRLLLGGLESALSVSTMSLSVVSVPSEELGE
ncbi:uncharacterized protein G2W53_032524 [Senna tora]|uniref:Uncharacterized protein n=1 Tax=Senna tora TaxID=362788 RepID=A0A834W7S0_9FABA|nr:uncharacterized protein G2W53_032524 [Senna tora]